MLSSFKTMAFDSNSNTIPRRSTGSNNRFDRIKERMLNLMTPHRTDSCQLVRISKLRTLIRSYRAAYVAVFPLK